MKFSIQFLCLGSLLSANGVLARHAASPSSNTVSTKQSLRTPAFLSRSSSIIISSIIGNNKSKEVVLDAIPRGGACSDSNPALFAKIGTTTIFESIAMFGILITSLKVAKSGNYPQWIPTVFNEPLVELLASFLVIFGSSFIGAAIDGGLSAATNQALNPNKVLGDPDWYANLVKPGWTPPGWIFPIMWVIVSKPTQLCAVSRMLKFGINDNKKGALLALAVYTTHLALGDAWNKVFFGLECIGRGTVVISIFFSALLTSAYLFYSIDKKAGLYMLPTCGWVAVATALQYSIYFQNKK